MQQFEALRKLLKKEEEDMEVLMTEVKADQVLDTKGLNCPMPVLKTKKAIDAIDSGKILEVISTDPGSKSDIPALLKRLGHELLETRESGKEIAFFIRKK